MQPTVPPASAFLPTVQAGPGATPRPPEVTERLTTALAAQLPEYRPRTRHFDGHEHHAAQESVDPHAPPGAKPNFTNRLLLEASPYLRQHAHNPVDWWPWGQAAFEQARLLNRPIFLSIGYSTCHWCHVMEHESFENLGVARLLNERYIAVKVDREERPDVDSVYMTALQATQGGGGWPMSVWLAPGQAGVQGLPFFAGTYFPPRSGMRGQRQGFEDILSQLADLYQNDTARVLAHGMQIADAVRQHLGTSPSGELVGPEATDRVVAELTRSFDDIHGGRRVAPKFPSQTPISLLLRHWLRTGEAASRDMALFTLKKMAAGGIYDHVGGGWHRYSVDGRWFAPHFEKMLYDQALITLAAVETWQATRDPELERVVRETMDYLLREMRHPDGAFYSATDADSEGREGLYFLWTIGQLRDVLGEDAAVQVATFYNATEAGNFEGSNILHRELTLAEFARQQGAEPDLLWQRLRQALDKLYEARQGRIPPLRDDKILASWNGLAISALARAGFALEESRYVQAAVNAAEFVLQTMRPHGRLVHAYLEGPATGPGFLDDHAFLIQGVLDLLEATGEGRWLQEALALQAAQDAHFADAQAGGWFATADDAETLLARGKPDHDGAEPTGNSVAAGNLVRLAAWTGEDRFTQGAEAALKAFGQQLREFPAALSEMLLAVEALHASLHEVVLVRPEASRAEAFEPWLAALRGRFLPHRVLLRAAAGRELAELAQLAPPAAERAAVGGQVTAYVCRQGTCGLPATEVEDLLRQLLPR